MNVKKFLERLRKAEVTKICSWLAIHSDYDYFGPGTRESMVSWLFGIDDSVLIEALEETLHITFFDGDQDDWDDSESMEQDEDIGEEE